MKVAKMSISMDSALAARVRAAAERAGQPLSVWIAEAVAARLRSDAITEYLAEYQTRHGAFTADELAAARREIGIPDSDGVSP